MGTSGVFSVSVQTESRVGLSKSLDDEDEVAYLLESITSGKISERFRSSDHQEAVSPRSKPG